jgi:hypothetical protein
MASNSLGSAWAFLAACAIVILWVVTGPSDAGQLVINPGPKGNANHVFDLLGLPRLYIAR